MHTETGPWAGVEWGGRPDDDCDAPADEHRFPVLPDPCDGRCPDGWQRPCIEPGSHHGHHRDIAGNRWVDDGLNDHPRLIEPESPDSSPMCSKLVSLAAEIIAEPGTDTEKVLRLRAALTMPLVTS